MQSIKAQAHVQAMNVVHPLLMKALQLPCATIHLATPLGKSNTHILWSLGHLVWAYDVATGIAIGVPPGLPARYSELFAFGTKPTKDDSAYPSREELTHEAQAAFERVTARIATMTDEELAQPLPASHPLAAFFPNVDVFLSAGPFHTGYHLGQIGLLRVAQGEKPLMEL